MRLAFSRLLFCCTLLLSGCASPVQRAQYLPAAQIPANATPAPVLFRGAELLLPVGADIGVETKGEFCGWPRYPVSRLALKDAIDKDYLKQTFRDALESQGYDVTGSLDLAYDLEDEDDRADFAVSAKIREVSLDICEQDPGPTMFFFIDRAGTKGQFYMEIEWTVYDALHRHTVYKTRTGGYTKRTQPNEEGLSLMFTDAFAMAAHNLGADPAFRDLIVNGITPPPEQKEEKPERPRRFDPQEPVILPSLPAAKAPFIPQDKNSPAVTIEKFGHASGFFITPQGHILTTASAVGDALRTRIITATGDTMIAEVLRTDKIRNVALLKLEDRPTELTISLQPLRTDWPRAGDKIFALGTPAAIAKTANTLTSGIISARRENIRHNGVRQDFLQADITLSKGSEGGPVLDEHGNITAIAASGQDQSELHYLIPLDQALAALQIAAPKKP